MMTLSLLLLLLHADDDDDDDDDDDERPVRMKAVFIAIVRRRYVLAWLGANANAST